MLRKRLVLVLVSEHYLAVLLNNVLFSPSSSSFAEQQFQQENFVFVRHFENVARPFLRGFILELIALAYVTFLVEGVNRSTDRRIWLIF